mmetsp:Transcript_12492/g.12564  ORF Transcript_12492/g.12564 Transcript_12492/m.12564 type:complete len:615 (+) Transcript_12492:232-2076(+)
MFLTAVITAFLAFTVDLASQEMVIGRKYISFNIDEPILGLFVWVSTAIVLVLCAASFGEYVSQAAEGAGIAEIKVFLAGVELPNFLNWKCLFAKVCGLSFALGSGLMIGRCGPFVHLAAIVADRLLTLDFLKHLRNNTTYRNQIMAASVAAGVAATFGTPIGGVIFSIEVTASFYIVNNLWRATFCGVVSTITFWLLHLLGITDLVEKTDYPKYHYNLDIFLFIAMGVVCGFMGSAFVEFGKRLVWYRNRKVIPWLHKRYRYACFLATTTACFVFFIPWLQNSDRKLLNHLFGTDELGDLYRTPEVWGTSSPIPTIAALFFLKFILSGMDISANTPAGFFMPVLVLGAVVGRFFGEISSLAGDTVPAGIFSAVGAAALVASATHTISVAIIVFEITGSIQYLIPMCISCVIAYTIGFTLNTSIYDAFLGLRGLPYLPAFRTSEVYTYHAKDMLDTSITSIVYPCSLKDLLDAVKNITGFTRIPVVDTEGYIIADVSIASIKNYLTACYELDTEGISQEAKQDIAREITHPKGEGVIFDISEQSREQIDKFWSSEVDFRSPLLRLNSAPLSVSESTSLAKVHYLFLMLGVMQIYVTSSGRLLGVVSYEFFAKGIR